MPLKEIKRHLDERTPQSLIDLFTQQRKNVEEKIQHLQRTAVMIDARLGTTRRGLEANIDTIEAKHCGQELIFAGEQVHCEYTQEALEDAASVFYDLCGRENIIYGYPLGTMVAKESLLKGEWHMPNRFYFKVPRSEGRWTKTKKPEGLYVTGFERTSYSGPQKLYPKLFEYIQNNGLVITGNSYEEFLLDEISIKESDNYLLQVSIQVERI